MIEKSQRSINIAFVSDFSKNLNLLAIDILEDLEAAGTKENFFPFKPEFVGGISIVDLFT